MFTFLKLGGSLITDKSQPETANTTMIAHAADQIAQAVNDNPDLHLLIGHGSGSFGHVVASQYNTRRGVHSSADWIGFAHVSVVAARLNHMVLEALHRTGIPVIRMQPSALLIMDGRHVSKMEIEPLQRALDAGLVPLIYGDVAFDRDQGGTIISTEELFVALAEELHPHRILLASRVSGVLDQEGGLIPNITPASVSMALTALGGSAEMDVTGGMRTKVTSMLELCQTVPGLTIRIFDGRPADNIYRLLTNSTFKTGTLISED